MAAPTPTARQTPNGRKIGDGYQSLITVASNPDLAIWEISIKPPSMDGGELNDTTTMHSTGYRNFSPKQLKTAGDAVVTAAYDPAVLADLNALVNVNDTWTVTFPDGVQYSFFGVLRMVEFEAIEEGKQPTLTATIRATNLDTDCVAQDPVVTDTGGTTSC